MSRPRANRAVALVAVAAVLTLIGCGSAGPSRAQAPSAEDLAAELVANDAALQAGIGQWLEAGDPPTVPPPAEVMGAAGLLQERIRFLAARPRGYVRAALASLRARVSAGARPALPRQVKDLVAAARKLRRLHRGAPKRKLKVGEPASLAELLGHYRKAQRRTGVGVHYLAAINHVETKFGRVKSRSTAGARGPMQFIPSTWKIYGEGSIHDPHDAIQAAARLLRDRGAPGNYGRALYAYNPSKLYVAAVTVYARLLARDPDAIYFLYCWGA